MRFPPEFVDELRSQITTSDVVSKKVALKLHGKEYLGLCPFHNEKSPSFSVNNEKAFYHCFGCGAHGDIVKFTMETEGLSFPEAVVKLANDAGIAVPVIKEDKEYDQYQKEYQELYEITEKACQFFQDNLYSSAGREGMAYLKRRGMSDAHIRKFRMGYALNSYDALIKHLKSAGYTKESLTKAGLVSQKTGGDIYDKFRNRVVFPILDKKERVIAFSGRALGADDKPKYLNSPETKLFKKGELVFNYAFARQMVHEKKSVVLVEGNMDVVSLYTHGIENVVAPLGTAVTTEQLQLLWKISPEIVVCLDGDFAGKKAMIRVVGLALPLITPTRTMRFAFLPNDTDPDDFVKNYGASAVENLLKNALPLSEVIWNHQVESLGLADSIVANNGVNPEKKALLEQRINEQVELIKDENSKKHFRQYYKEKLWGLKGVYYGKSGVMEGSVRPSRVKADKRLTSDIEIYERDIIALILNYPELIHYNIDNYSFVNMEFVGDENSRVKDLVLEFFEEMELSEELRQGVFVHLEESNFHDYVKHGKKYKDFVNDLSKAKSKLTFVSLKYRLSKLEKEYKEYLVLENATGEGQTELFEQKTRLEKRIITIIENDE